MIDFQKTQFLRFVDGGLIVTCFAKIFEGRVFRVFLAELVCKSLRSLDFEPVHDHRVRNLRPNGNRELAALFLSQMLLKNLQTFVALGFRVAVGH